MARINTTVLVTQVASAAHRANIVRKDPAVMKAAKQARGDFAQASRSAAELFVEASAAWRRQAR